MNTGIPRQEKGNPRENRGKKFTDACALAPCLARDQTRRGRSIPLPPQATRGCCREQQKTDARPTPSARAHRTRNMLVRRNQATSSVQQQQKNDATPRRAQALTVSVPVTLPPCSPIVGDAVGTAVGDRDPAVGLAVGFAVGTAVGATVKLEGVGACEEREQPQQHQRQDARRGRGRDSMGRNTTEGEGGTSIKRRKRRHG